MTRVTLDKQVRVVKQLDGELFRDSIPAALKQAQEHAADGGYILTFPELIQARLSLPDDHKIWGYVTPHTEEYVGTTRHGTPFGVVVHGPGLITSGALKHAYEHDCFGSSIRLVGEDIRRISEGRLPSEKRIPVYGIDEIWRGVKDLPRQYAVIFNLRHLEGMPRDRIIPGDMSFDVMAVARAGGSKEAQDYVNRILSDAEWNTYSRMPRDLANSRMLIDLANLVHTSLDQMDPSKPQGRMSIYFQDQDGNWTNEMFRGNGSFLAISGEELREYRKSAFRKGLEQAYRSLFGSVEDASRAPKTT